ncbi:hypothetical protein GEMRC1_013631 [Eukaryota sp. GEM-RC1]
MRPVKVEEFVKIPQGVKITIKHRNVTVTGPRGTLARDLNHQTFDMAVDGDRVRVTCYFGNKKKIAAIRTMCTHMQNMIKGVTRGYKYTMRAAYAHFPISMVIADDGSSLTVKNFIGERFDRVIDMFPGVTCIRSENKDEIHIEGNDLEKVSLSASSIQEACKAKNKDIRKFLDGIYVSQKSHIEEEE